jgi:hypothetical protein
VGHRQFAIVSSAVMRQLDSMRSRYLRAEALKTRHAMHHDHHPSLQRQRSRSRPVVKLVIRTNGLPLRDTCQAAGFDQTSQSDRFGAGAATGRGGPVFGLKAITSPTVSNSLGRDSRRLAGRCGLHTAIRVVSRPAEIPAQLGNADNRAFGRLAGLGPP